MSTFTENESREIYRAAYRGLNDDQFRPRGFDVAIWPDGEARPISSGCAAQAGAMTAISNVTSDAFGDGWEDLDEAGFADMCMECFGLVDSDEE